MSKIVDLTESPAAPSQVQDTANSSVGARQSLASDISSNIIIDLTDSPAQDSVVELFTDTSVLEISDDSITDVEVSADESVVLVSSKQTTSHASSASSGSSSSASQHACLAPCTTHTDGLSRGGAPRGARADSSGSAKPVAQKPLEIICPICLEGEGPFVSTSICSHIFCLECLKKHLKYSKTCPTCRSAIGRNKYHRIYNL